MFCELICLARFWCQVDTTSVQPTSVSFLYIEALAQYGLCSRRCLSAVPCKHLVFSVKAERLPQLLESLTHQFMYSVFTRALQYEFLLLRIAYLLFSAFALLNRTNLCCFNELKKTYFLVQRADNFLNTGFQLLLFPLVRLFIIQR